MTLDTPADKQVLDTLVAALGDRAGWEDYAKHYLQHDLQGTGLPARNEGYRT